MILTLTANYLKKEKITAARKKYRYINEICEEIESNGIHNETRDFIRKMKLLAR